MLIKNFSFSIIYKVLGMIVSLAMVPVLINILGVEQYGLWVTLTSLLVWISLFDFGLGYALKNTVSKSIANNKIKEAYIETQEVLKVTFLISFLVLLLFVAVLFYLDIFKNNIFLSLILFVPFILSFPFKIGSPILQGARKIALESGLLFINTFLFFVSIMIVKFTNYQINIMFIAILFIMSYIISLSFVWINGMKIIDMKIIDLKNIFNYSINLQRIKVALKFFGLQVSSLILYSIGTLIVFTYLSSIDAAHYDVLNKVFIFGLSIFNIGIAVFWPEIAHHLENKDFFAIRRLYFVMVSLSVLFLIASFIVSFFASDIVALWTNDKININQKEAIYFAFLVSVQALAYSGAVVLNAFEKINYQLILSLCTTICMIPLSLYLINSDYGIASIPLSAGILTLIPMLYCNTHAYYLIKKGILNVKTNTK